MSITLKLIAVEFPVHYQLELINSFINSFDKIQYSEKLHSKLPDKQIIYQQKKYMTQPDDQILKSTMKFGDEEFEHTVILYFDTQKHDLNLKKMKPRGINAPEPKKKPCESCTQSCPHQLH